MNKELSMRVALKRKNMGLSVRGFARLYNISPTVLNQIENNKIDNPSMNTMHAIRRILDLTYSELFEYCIGEIDNRKSNKEDINKTLCKLLSKYNLDSHDIQDIVDYIKFKVARKKLDVIEL